MCGFAGGTSAKRRQVIEPSYRFILVKMLLLHALGPRYQLSWHSIAGVSSCPRCQAPPGSDYASLPAPRPRRHHTGASRRSVLSPGSVELRKARSRGPEAGAWRSQPVRWIVGDETQAPVAGSGPAGWLTNDPVGRLASQILVPCDFSFLRRATLRSRLPTPDRRPLDRGLPAADCAHLPPSPFWRTRGASLHPALQPAPDVGTSTCTRTTTTTTTITAHIIPSVPTTDNI